MKPSAFLRDRKALVGMIHLPPLPGSTNYAGQPLESIVHGAIADACALAEAGFHAAILQNTHDLPATATAPVETVAFLSAIGRELRHAVQMDLGVNVLKNDAEGGLAVAAAVGAPFVRLKVYVGAAVGAEGLLTPSAPAALRMRQRLGTDTELWVDLFDRTSAPLVPQPLPQLAEWVMKFGDASALIVTGATMSQSIEMIREVRSVVTSLPVVIGGGVTHANVAQALMEADAVIVGSALEEHPFTGPVSAAKASAFVRAAHRGGERTED
jgi:membrane complex biogenesis BtpA family protein